MSKNFLDELLASFNVNKKETIYVAVTPGVGLEMVQVDPAVKSVVNYSFRPLGYNEGMREIVNYEDFKIKLAELFEELKVKTDSDVILSLPTVHFGKVELPNSLDDDGINMAIVSEAERSYVFKKSEPVVNWFKAVTKENSETYTIIYSAIQKSVVNKIKNIFSEVGANLVGIEPSLMSILQALSFTHLEESNMEANHKWNLLLINSYGYSIVSLNGKNIIDYYDEPLPLRTYEIEEAYAAIKSSLELSLAEFSEDNLYIISETDLVSAEHLASILNKDGGISYLENNNFKKNEFLPVTLNVLPEYVMKVSLEAIGVAISMLPGIYPNQIDFIADRKLAKGGEETFTLVFGNHYFIVTEATLKKVLVILAVVLLVPTLLLLGILPQMTKNKQTKLDVLQKEKEAVENSIAALTGHTSTKSVFVIRDEIERVVMANRVKLIAYSALGESVPSDLWLVSFVAKDDGKVDIKGYSSNVRSIYRFYSSMKYSWADSQLRLQKLDMHAGTIEAVVSSSSNMIYEFEITNINNSSPEPSDKQDKTNEDKKQTNTENVDADNKPQSPENNPDANANKAPADLPPAKPVNQLEPVDIGN